MVRLINRITGEITEGPMPQSGAPTGGMRRNRGDLPPDFNSNAEPWGGPIDQVARRNDPSGLKSRSVQTVAVDPFTGQPINRPRDVIQDIPAPDVTQRTASTVDAANPIDGYRLGLTPPPADTSAQRAINEILVPGGVKNGAAFRGGWGSGGFGRRDPLAAAPPGSATGGNWAGMDPLIQAATGEAPVTSVAGPQPPAQVMAAMSARPPQMTAQPSQMAPQIHAALMAKQQMQNPAAQAAINAGKRSYVASNGSGVLSANALMPTRSISGGIRRTYGD